MPKVRSVNSLEPGIAVPPSVSTCDESHDDYEMAGVMQESDDEDCDCIDKADELSDANDCDYVLHGSREVPPSADEAGGAEIRAAGLEAPGRPMVA